MLDAKSQIHMKCVKKKLKKAMDNQIGTLRMDRLAVSNDSFMKGSLVRIALVIRNHASSVDEKRSASRTIRAQT